jgi:RNA polymerase sigma factor (sigma-70 family)
MADGAGDKLWWRNLLRRVVRATGDRMNGEDHLHAAFVRLQEYRGRNEVRNPAAFLVRTAVNIAVDEHRHRRVRNEGDDLIHGLLQVSGAEPLQDEALVARERLRRVTEALQRLSPRTREIFLMHRLDGMKYREIAEHFGISVSAVEKHVAKAVLFVTELSEDE